MIRSHTIILLLLIALGSSGQGTYGQAMTKADTLELLDFAQTFGQAMNSDDVDKIRAMSLEIVHCHLCIDDPTPPTTYENFYTELDTFIHAAYREPALIKLWSVMETEKAMINAVTLKKTFRQEELKGRDQVTILEVFFTTLKRDEYAKGHEGASTALQFVKVGDEFKFYGIDTVP
jgi:hypothetical protein